MLNDNEFPTAESAVDDTLDTTPDPATSTAHDDLPKPRAAAVPGPAQPVLRRPLNRRP